MGCAESILREGWGSVAIEDMYSEAGAQHGAFRALFGLAFVGAEGQMCAIVYTSIGRPTSTRACTGVDR